MHLCKFEIHNFKGITSASFEWADIIVLIGENNTGKSTALEALRLFLSGSQIKDGALFHDKLTDAEHAIELIGYFDQLTADEQGSVAVAGRMHGDQWILKKRYWLEAGGGDDADRGGWKEQYSSFSAAEQIEGWPEAARSWSAFPESYQPVFALMPDRGPRPTRESCEILRALIREHLPGLVTTTAPTWQPNPGGGGNWKSNANSIIPRIIYVPAVHDANDEAASKDSSAYGKIINLIVEKKMMRRPEVEELRQKLNAVLRLFNGDPDDPEAKAEEIRDIERRINERLNEVIGGIVHVLTSEPDLRTMLLPSTELSVRECDTAPDTKICHQGHGMQRTLILSLLQILSEVQSEPDEEVPEGQAPPPVRAVILAVEEPELYMHPQMERKMRDTLFRLAEHNGLQVICTTHSPVFLDLSERHRAIVRVIKAADRQVTFSQVTRDLFPPEVVQTERDRLKHFACFHPTTNEVLFAKKVVLLEEASAIWAFERAAELTGVFTRHPHLRRDTTLVDCDGKSNIPMFQRVLNHFSIPYTVVHDEDTGNAAEVGNNQKVANLVGRGHPDNKHFMLTPTDLEGMLGYHADSDKPYRALKKVEELHSAGTLPAPFIRAMNWVYFGQDTEAPPILAGRVTPDEVAARQAAAAAGPQ